jgi:hypothetical protein
MSIPRPSRPDIGAWTVLAGLALGLLSPVLSARADPPVVEPGECLYLVGAPAGAPAAAREQTHEGTRVRDVCNAVDEHVGTNEVGPNSASVFIASPLGSAERGCEVAAWVGHEFDAGGTARTTGRITVTGALLGHIAQFNTSAAFAGVEGRVAVEMQVVATDPALPSVETILASAVLLERSVTIGELDFDEPFSQRLEATFVHGRTYGARLVVTLQGAIGFYDLDFGSPGSGNNVRYDSIEVCLDAPPDDGALHARFDRLEEDALERALYQRRCYPGVWLPAALGGRAEDARALVATRLADATASGDPGVNVHVARMRLDAADADLASGRYQRACRDLSEGLRALTTP